MTTLVLSDLRRDEALAEVLAESRAKLRPLIALLSATINTVPVGEKKELGKS